MALRLLFLLIFTHSSAYAVSPVWQASKGQQKMFLGGTIHILRDIDYPLPAAYDKAYQQSDLLVFETDIGESQSTSFQQRMLQAVLLPPGQKLSSLLQPQTLVELEAYLTRNQMTLHQLSMFKPSMISMTLTLMELKKLGVGDKGVDQYYFNKASGDGKKTLSLESIQQHIDFLANMGKGIEDLMIRQTLEDNKTIADLFDDMVQGWRSGDADRLEKVFIDPMREDFSPIYDELLVTRNRNWMPKILEMMNTPETELILVGSAHLIGPDGLLQSLQQKGFQITQLD